MEKILEQYFVQNNELVITNIGTLYLTKKPASWIEDTLHAPELIILFTTATKKPSTQFYNYLAESLNISNEEANIQYEQFLHSIFETKDKTLTIGNLGSIEKMGEEYTWKSNFTSKQYYKDITISPVNTIDENEKINFIQWTRIAIILFIIAIAAILFKYL